MSASVLLGVMMAMLGIGLDLGTPVEGRTETEPPTMAPGGGQSPSTGGRPDQHNPQLGGSGNRGTGQRGTDGVSSIDPGKVRSAPKGSGRVVGQVLSIQGDTYIIRQADGHELTLKSTQQTDVHTVISMGETVEAQFDGGVLTQIKPASR